MAGVRSIFLERVALYVPLDFRKYSISRRNMQVINPTTEEIAEISETPLAAISRQLDRAKQAQQHWRTLNVAERASVLMPLADSLAAGKIEFARLIAEDMGKPFASGQNEVMRTVGGIEYLCKKAPEWLAPEITDAGREAGYIEYAPLGAVGVITPWNGPVWLSMVGILSSLLAGNAAIYKPSENSLRTGIAMAMVVAEEVGAKWEDVIIQHDMKAPFQPVGGGSDGTTAAAWVMKEAAAKLKKLILEEAAPQLKAKPEELDIKDSVIFVVQDPSKSISFSQLRPPSTGNIQSYLSATYNGRPPTALWAVGMGKKLDTMNALFCEVAVDSETGKVEVLRHGVAADTGKVIRPISLEGQIQQTMMFSEGCQLSEEIIWDKASGVRLNSNMFDYRKPTIVDIAPTDMDLLETRAGNAAYGANGISHSLSNTHIIVCAIQNAIGKWVDPPATPDKILKTLGKA